MGARPVSAVRGKLYVQREVYVAVVTGDVYGHFNDRVYASPVKKGESGSLERIEVYHDFVVAITVVRRTRSAAVSRSMALWKSEHRKMVERLESVRQE